MVVECPGTNRGPSTWLGGQGPQSRACLGTGWVATEEGVQPISSAPRLALGDKGRFWGGSSSGPHLLRYS